MKRSPRSPVFGLLLFAMLLLLALGVWLVWVGVTLPDGPAFVSTFGTSM